MLNGHDLEVIAREPGLPGLSILLDPERALGLLQRLYPEQAILNLSLSYLKYKPHTNCLAGFAAGVGAQKAIRISAKAYPEKEYAKERARCQKGNGAGQGGHEPHFVDGWQLAVWSFPRDRKLPGLAALGEADARRRLLQDLLPAMPELWPAGMETLRYKNERRYVGKLLVGGAARALIKVYEARDFKNACRAARTIGTFAADGGLSVAGPLGISQDERIIISRWLDGRPLRQLLHEARDLSRKPGQLQAVGAALAGFHRESPGSLATAVPENEALSVLAAANATAFLCPALAVRLRRLAAGIGAELLSMPRPHHPIHGDFSSDQVLVDGADDGGIAIVDYDQARIGDPAADLGSFTAQLFYDEAAGALAAGTAAALADVVLKGYLEACGQRETLLRYNLHTAAKLLQLTPQAFRTRHPQWPELMARLVYHAVAFWRNHARHETGT